MKKLILIFVFITISILLTSCGQVEYNREYQLSEDGKIYFYGTDKLYTGTIIDTSDVIIEFQVVKGIKHGEFKVSYLNGNVEKHGYIDNNKNEGAWKYYFENGQLESQGFFVNDLPEGEWISYYQDGQIKTKGSYLNGKQYGRWISFTPTGTIENVQFYEEGELETSY
jgi:hypothetical protein